MVQAMVLGKVSNPSKRRRKPQPDAKQCWFCNTSFRASKQSKFCSDYCVQQACRRRREALIETFAALMVKESEYVTAILYGSPFQITFDHAIREAEQCVKSKHKVVKLKLEQLGWAYNEREKQWFLQPRLR